MGKIGELLSDEESMKQLTELAQIMMSGDGGGNKSEASGDRDSQPETENSPETNGGGFDFGSLMQLQGIMGAMTQKDKNSELLLALKPHLREEKQARVDKAIKLLKLLALWNVLKDSGMLKNLL
ncbi:MAG: hypothetical protein PUB66_01730 [Oscillospiraceae bacterium]|nr:hypothetical protein [Ruminococcus sp.]MDD6097441.1 hypothetical protein [Oscillospiraceae bacterium]